jgi:hypothetical protein
MLAEHLIADAGGGLDLDFHAIMHWGQDVGLDKHSVPTRSQRTRSVLTFFAQDASTDTLVYAAPVNLSEAESFGNHCVVAGSSFGSLIHTAVGSAGGSGGLRAKRSGWAA